MARDSNPAPILIVVLTVGLAIAGAGAWVLLMRAPEVPATGSAAPTSSEQAVRPASSSGSGAAAEPGSAPGSGSGSTPEAATPVTKEDRQRARMARDLERERIWSALRKQHGLEPESPGSAVPNPTEIGQLPELDQEYIRSAIREQLVPVAVDCYNSALQDDPELVGSLVLDFVIVGAEDVGGVVEDAQINEDTTIESAFMQECLRESLIAVTFEPPPGGGRIEVTYPLNFTVEDE